MPFFRPPGVINQYEPFSTGFRPILSRYALVDLQRDVEIQIPLQNREHGIPFSLFGLETPATGTCTYASK
ncbi:MAG: hypothetical protein ACE5OZ_17520 [Candidatus Heimdallarchaeota archaeon]